MNNLVNYLENLQFEGYFNYESSIRSYKENENYKFELMAFQFVTKNYEDGYDYGVGSYFKPYYEFAENIYPTLEDISCEALSYWETRSNESKNPYLIARYADLVWTFSKLHKGCINKPYVYASKAIENYIQFSNGNINKSTDLDIKHSIIRALNLANTLNQKEKLNLIYRKMIDIENSMEDEYIGLWGFCYDELIENGADISELVESEIIQSMQDRVNRLISTTNESIDKFSSIEYGVSKLTKYYFKKGNSNEVRRLLSLIEKVIDDSSESQLKEFRYNKLLELFNAIQIHQDDNRIIRKISEAAETTKENLKETSVTKSINKEDYEAFINSYYTNNLIDDLKAVAIRFIPNIEENLKRIEERRNEGIGMLSELISHVKINKDGMPITTMDLSIENDRLSSQLEITIGVQSSFFNDIFSKLEVEYNLNAEKLGDVLKQSPILNEENHVILVSALKNYFQKDYIAFIHVMTPYIESTLRNIVNLTGDSIYKLNKNGSGYDAILLGDILAKEYLEEIMTKDLVYYFKFLYNDKKGYNLRNIVAHGIAHPSLFNKANANLIMHTLLTFLLFKKNEQ